MIGMTKKDELLAYFDRLIEAYKNDYYCAKEIAEVIEALRKEYGLENPLAKVSTEDLANELAKRDGVEEYTIGAHGETAKLTLETETEGTVISIDGPARITVNKD